MDPRTEIAQNAWSLREEGNPIEAMALWQNLYYEYINDKNWERAISSLIDIAICWKMQAEITGNASYFETSRATLYHIKHLADLNDIPLRNDYHYHLAGVETAVGDYEKAITSYEHYLATSKTPEEEANILAHVGYAKAQHGKKEEGIKELRKSIEQFEEAQKVNNFQGKNVFLIWKLGAMLRLAEVLEDKDEARELTERVLGIAKEKGLGARAKQAEKLLSGL
jgi:tetratricopeptide (TPR) repeat protein